MPTTHKPLQTEIDTDATFPDLSGRHAPTFAAAPMRRAILVVEDENVTRMAAVDMLQEAGFHTAEASSGHHAMLVLEEMPGISVLVTDIDMPLGIDGITLAACVHYRWPNIGIVMTSGKITPVPGDLPNGTIFIPKPYHDEQLLNAVRWQIEIQTGMCYPLAAEDLSNTSTPTEMLEVR